ncbi:MAG TPA: DnaJ domain-containing protein [Kofleriaceae bacterium]|nr:DnaJ domain-containing protein [Kofleriaceae bacterium]
MAKKTYYMILGVSHGETSSGIRAAYRDRARQLHPDVAGDGATRAFQDLNEAYGVLSDPSRRRAYNAELAANAHAVPRTAISILDPPETIHPSFAEVRDRFVRNFTGLHVPKAERIEPLDFEVLLTHDEAASGCVVPIGVPTFHRCPHCGGSGATWLFACTYCRQSGMIEIECVVSVRVPPMVPPGEIYEVALGGLGIHNFRLRLHVFVDA